MAIDNANVRSSAAIVTSTNVSTLQAAPGAGFAIYITHWKSSTPDAQNIRLDLKSGTNIIDSVTVPSGGGFIDNVGSGAVLKCNENEALNVVASATPTTRQNVSWRGYIKDLLHG